MKKNLLVLLVVAVLCFMMSACGEPKEPEYSEEGGEYEEVELQKVDSAFLKKARFIYNGFEFGVREKFDDIKDKLGAETRAPQTYKPCAAFVEGEVTTHYYDGFELETNDQGYIYLIRVSTPDYPESKLELVSGIKLGSSHDEVINTYGKTESDNEYSTSYSFEDFYFGIGYDQDNGGVVNYISQECSI